MCDEIRRNMREVAAVLRQCPGLIPLRTVLRYLGVVVLVLMAAVLADFANIKAWWVAADLSEYARVIRHADCPLEEKERLLDRVEALEDCLRHGSTIGFLRWQRCNRAVRDLLDLGLSADNIALLERELHRVEREIVEEMAVSPR
jgi:hypothetical protein